MCEHFRRLKLAVKKGYLDEPSARRAAEDAVHAQNCGWKRGVCCDCDPEISIVAKSKADGEFHTLIIDKDGEVRRSLQ